MEQVLETQRSKFSSYKKIKIKSQSLLLAD